MANFLNPYYNGAANLKRIIKTAADSFTGNDMQQTVSTPKTVSTDSKAARTLPSSAKPAEKPPVSVSQPNVEQHILPVDNDDLIKGIILSEILGPPKGRRTGRW